VYLKTAYFAMASPKFTSTETIGWWGRLNNPVIDKLFNSQPFGM
jgi:hypothetical protein